MIAESILETFHKRNVLVTGGTGLIGRQVVQILAHAGACVRVVSLDKINVHPQAEHVFGDLTSFEFCKQVIQGTDYVFHIAGIKGSVEVTKSRPASFFVPLLMLNTNVLEACRLNKVQKVVYTSSIGAYASAEVFKETDEDLVEGPPMDMFPGWAKRMAEKQIQAYKIQYNLDNFAIVRPCNIYGPGDNFDPSNAMVIPSLMARIYHKEDPVLIWGDGSAIRDFAYSEDVAKGVILALYHGTGSRYVNLASGQGCSIKELVETLHSFLSFNYQFDISKPSGFPKRVMDISLARELLGYNPTTSLREGLQKTWEWYMHNYDEHLQKLNYFRAS
ncbi:MAG: NAD-dependent epimerase/dehydratase family protein [Candidatus Tectimicrobiota bacterium]